MSGAAPEPTPRPEPAPPAPPALPAPASGPDGRPRRRVHWWLVVLIVATDQLTKAILCATLDVYESRPVIDGLLDLVHVRNEGVAFGVLNTLALEHKWIYTTALASLALGGIGYYARRLRPEERWARAGLSLILGGALGNLIDRVRLGYVVDFVDVYVGTWHFWAFNAADAAISVGAVFVFVDLLFVRAHASHSV